MSLFSNPWTKYWLRKSPFFTEALEIFEIDSKSVDDKDVVSLFVGRKIETEQIVNLIRRGGGTRFIVVGDSGVGKTTLVNYVRNLAKKENYLTPLKEITVNTKLIAYKLMIETIVLLYDEIKEKEDIKLNDELVKKLKHLDPLIDLEDYNEEYDPLVSSTPNKLILLFKELTTELKKMGFPPVILHYNNFDMIKDEEKLTDFLNNMREFFDNEHAIIILLGDDLLDYCISLQPRLRQKYQHPIYVGKLTLIEVKKILQQRIEFLRIDPTREFELYEEEVVNTLYILFDGNIREILNSLSFAFQKISNSNIPTKLNVAMMRDILSKGVHDIYLNKLTQLQKNILKEMMKIKKFTCSQIAILTKKPAQNFSQSFIPKFMDTKIITLAEIKGREKYYSVKPEIYWWNLEKNEKEKTEDNILKEKKRAEAQKSIMDF